MTSVSCCADRRIKAAVDKMAKHQDKWEALRFKRTIKDASKPRGYQPWVKAKKQEK